MPYVAEPPDSNSLMQVAGAPATTLGVNPLSGLTHFEYQYMYGKLPMSMAPSTVNQNKVDGSLSVTKTGNIDMSSVGGLWIPCAGSLSPWNTRLGSHVYRLVHAATPPIGGFGAQDYLKKHLNRKGARTQNKNDVLSEFSCLPDR